MASVLDIILSSINNDRFVLKTCDSFDLFIEILCEVAGEAITPEDLIKIYFNRHIKSDNENGAVSIDEKIYIPLSSTMRISIEITSDENENSILDMKIYETTEQPYFGIFRDFVNDACKEKIDEILKAYNEREDISFYEKLSGVIDFDHSVTNSDLYSYLSLLDLSLVIMLRLAKRNRGNRESVDTLIDEVQTISSYSFNQFAAFDKKTAFYKLMNHMFEKVMETLVEDENI